MHTLAIDIGGTKIAAAVVDDRGAVARRTELPTAAHYGAEEMLRRAYMAADAVIGTFTEPGDPARPERIGISSGGDVDYANGRIVFNTDVMPGWGGLALAERFGQRYGLPARVDNDGNCSALAEAKFGAAVGASHALTLIVGTGIGAGFVLNGQALRGALGGALNPGQIWMDEEHLFEQVIASGALAHQFGAPISQIARDVARAAELPEPVSMAAWQLGRLAAICAAILDPDAIVIAGSILLFDERFHARTQQAFARYARPPHQTQTLRRSILGADSALIGASLI